MALMPHPPRNPLFSTDGSRAISEDLGTGYLCYSVTWARPNEATEVATLVCQGTTYSQRDAFAFLNGQQVELLT